jgi:hypothetical protein
LATENFNPSCSSSKLPMNGLGDNIAPCWSVFKFVASCKSTRYFV